MCSLWFTEKYVMYEKYWCPQVKVMEHMDQNCKH